MGEGLNHEVLDGKVSCPEKGGSHLLEECGKNDQGDPTCPGCGAPVAAPGNRKKSRKRGEVLNDN